MITTIIDDDIIKTWYKNWPKSIPEGGSSDENRIYQSFFDFLHKGTNLEIINYKNSDLSIIYTQLTSNRGENATIKINDKKNERPYKFKFDINTYFRHILFIKEDDEENREKYTKKNQFPIGFSHNFLDVFKMIDLFDKAETIPVRECENGFKSWSQLKDYIIDFSDVIIIDSFIFKSEETLVYNLYKIIKIISQNAKEREGSVNLLIVSSLSEDEVRRNESERLYKKMIDDLIRKEALNVNLGIAFLGDKDIKKEHDRSILFNFLRIKSGDSFVYFSSKGDFLTEGTEIDFQKQTRLDYCNTYDSLVNSVNFKIKELIKKKSNRLQGNIKNRLME